MLLLGKKFYWNAWVNHIRIQPIIGFTAWNQYKVGVTASLIDMENAGYSAKIDYFEEEKNNSAKIYQYQAVCSSIIQSITSFILYYIYS